MSSHPQKPRYQMPLVVPNSFFRCVYFRKHVKTTKLLYCTDALSIFVHGFCLECNMLYSDLVPSPVVMLPGSLITILSAIIPLCLSWSIVRPLPSSSFRKHAWWACLLSKRVFPPLRSLWHAYFRKYMKSILQCCPDLLSIFRHLMNAIISLEHNVCPERNV